MQFEVSLSPGQQKILAAAIASIPLIMIVASLTTFVSAQIDRHHEAALLVRELARERAIVQQAPAKHERLSELRASPDWQSLFVAKVAGNPAGAAATIIKTAGGKLQQSTARRLESAGATEIDEHAVFTADIGQLSRILAALRGRRPMFVLRTISIRSEEGALTAPRVAPNTLTVEMTVAEFERPR